MQSENTESFHIFRLKLLSHNSLERSSHQEREHIYRREKELEEKGVKGTMGMQHQTRRRGKIEE